ncbi:MAG: preprotein translocase subunit SecE [Candidatus Dormibacteria bacterium]
MASEEESNAYEAGLGTGVRSIFVELSRVVWPTREELFRMTAVVVGFLIVIAALIGVIDVIFDKAGKSIYGS